MSPEILSIVMTIVSFVSLFLFMGASINAEKIKAKAETATATAENFKSALMNSLSQNDRYTEMIGQLRTENAILTMEVQRLRDAQE